MQEAAPPVPGEGVRAYTKDRHSGDYIRIRNYCRSLDVKLITEDWSPICDQFIGLASVDVGPNGIYESDMISLVAQTARRTSIQTLTCVRRGEEELTFIGSGDETLLKMGEVIS